MNTYKILNKIIKGKVISAEEKTFVHRYTYIVIKSNGDYELTKKAWDYLYSFKRNRRSEILSVIAIILSAISILLTFITQV